MRPSFPLFSSQRWYEWFPSTKIAQHPTMWRFLAYGQFRGTANLGIPSAATWASGYGVFDWDDVKSRYELTWFDPSPDYWWYASSWSNASFAWVNDTTVRLVGNPASDSSTDTVRHAAKFSVASDGKFTWIQNAETHCGYDLVNRADFYPGWAVGYGGGIIYPYADGTSAPSSNCYIGKITDTNSATNLGPLRSGLAFTAQHAALCLLGPSAAGNGYAFGVQNCGSDQTVYAAVYNISAATPSIKCSLNFTGVPGSYGGIRLGARKIALSVGGPSYRTHLLYTNSDTDPTSLTLGSYATCPALPFTPERVDYPYMTGDSFNCQNFWSAEGKAAGICAYNMLPSDYSAGETYKWRYIPVKITSSGTSDISISALATDHMGTPVPMETWWGSNLQTINNYAFQFVGAPDGKASLLWSVGSPYIPTNQTVFQL